MHSFYSNLCTLNLGFNGVSFNPLDKRALLAFPNLVRTTCLAHDINRVAKEMRNQFPLVNINLECKKILLKAAMRVQLYKESFPGLQLPQQLVITRFRNSKNFILESSSDSDEAAGSLKNNVIPNRLVFIVTFT